MERRRPARVVLVDDDRATRAAIAGALAASHYTLLPAASGLRLVAHLHVDHPDAILLDTRPSWGDGIALCRALKQNPEFQDIPVVLLSRERDDGAPPRLACGASAWLEKPIDPARLVSTLDLVTRRAAQSV